MSNLLHLDGTGLEKTISNSPDSSFQSANEDGLNEAEFLKQWPISRPLTFKRLLQHWAVLTRQKNSHMTSLLRLLKHYKPVVDYDRLPATGQTLIYTDGNDIKSYGLTIPVDAESEKINLQGDSRCDGII